MFKKLSALLAVLFLLTAVGSAFAETEEEIINRYLNKAKKKQKDKLGYFSTSFSYGLLSSDNDLNKFTDYSNSRITPGSPLSGAWRSNQIVGEFGLMISSNTAMRIGFEYWTKIGTSTTGNYTYTTSEGTQTTINPRSEVQVYGFCAGFNHYLTNAPTEEGYIGSLALRIGAMGGLYKVNWDVFNGLYPYNLSLDNFDVNVTELSAFDATAPGVTVSAGADYPLPIFDMLLGADICYQYLNFTKVKSYNSVGEELYISYSGNGQDRVDLDFSGIRGKIELKRFFQW